MTLPQIVSRNQIQRIPTIAINERKTLSGGTDGDFYTTPTGKRAVIKGRAVCTGLGASATVELTVATISIQQWNASSGTGSNDDPKTIGVFVDFEVQLDAGEILAYTQNTGTNAEMNVFAEVLETPA